MTDNEIIKALEYCFTNDWNRTKCNKCAFYTGTTQCNEDLKSASIHLINRQKAEIEALIQGQETLQKYRDDEIKRLQEENQRLSEKFNCQQTVYADLSKIIKEQAERLKTAKAKAAKEFAEIFLKKVHDNHYMLSDQINSKDYGMFTIGIEQAVNDTKKEMVGENND